MADIKPHFHGHRKRLRERFMANDGDGMPDYEILELLLAMAIPRAPQAWKPRKRASTRASPGSTQAQLLRATGTTAAVGRFSPAPVMIVGPA